MQLNQGQYTAVMHRDGPCMVLSGPGSGKTTVITNRVLTLTERYGIEPDRILVITFTRAAAEEMEKRYRKLSGSASGGAVFGTFHSVFFRMLRTEYGLKPEAVADESDKIRVLKEALFSADPELQADRELLSTLFTNFSAIKNSGADPDTFSYGSARIDGAKVYREYVKRMKEARMLDFDDMMLYTDRMLRTRPESLSFWRDRFRYILIDEFQDINPVQYEIVKLLASPGNHLFVVGDDDQSIYGFRSASPKLMLSFPHDFPECRTVELAVNYRSSSEIVSAASALISHNGHRFPKKLRSGAGPGGRVTVTEFPTEEEETEAIADEIARMTSGGTPGHEIAVLFRTRGGYTKLVQKLMARSVAFFVRDEPVDLFSHFAAAPVFGCLNFVTYGRKRSDFLRFMNCPYRGFLREDLTEETVDLSRVEAKYRSDPARSFRASKINFFSHQLDLLKRLGTPYAMINFFRIGLGYDEYLPYLAKKKHVEAAELVRILDEIQESARPYDTVEAWYAFVSSYRNVMKESAGKTAAPDAVQILTLHASKGLEYRTVFLPDVNEKVLPHEKAAGEEEMEEERRLFYVGMTRAARELRISFVRTRYQKPMEPSRFLSELS